MCVSTTRSLTLRPVLPGGLDQLLPAQHAAPALDERLEQPEFEGRQLHGRAILAYGRSIEIHFEVVETADARRLMFEPAQHRADARAQFARAERLGHVVIGAEFQSQDFLGFLCLGREQDDGCVDAGLAATRGKLRNPSMRGSITSSRIRSHASARARRNAFSPSPTVWTS